MDTILELTEKVVHLELALEEQKAKNLFFTVSLTLALGLCLADSWALTVLVK